MKVLPRSEHPISRKAIDPDALKVLYRLSNHGYVAYLVGGGVRDLLLGRQPKDFDVATSAHPGEVKKLFRNCRIIGKRFRLAHVLFQNNKIVEVSTFRTKSEFQLGDMPLEPVKRENTFGTPEEDAGRRDFTINSLFYDIKTFAVIDHVGGVEDLEHHRIRTIGDPEIRIREDPVRMLRAVKFAGRLGFEIDPALRESIGTLAAEIHKSPPPRILEEFRRMLVEGASAKCIDLLHVTGLLDVLLPRLEEILEEEPSRDSLFWKCLQAVDGWAEARERFSLAVLLSILFLHPLSAMQVLDLGQSGRQSAKMPGLDAPIRSLLGGLQVPRKDFEKMRLFLGVQSKFFQAGKRGFLQKSFLKKAYIGEALDVFETLLRAEGKDLKTVHKWRFLAKKFSGQ
jgi:poly(A) polymerase